MDELEISGKRYISTRRAAKEHKYHSDYIGQLIRAGKVEGQKVGRSWYVIADSLTEYLGKEGGPKVQAVRTPVIVSVVQTERVEITEPVQEKKVTTTKEVPAEVEAEEIKEEEAEIVETEIEDKEERQIPVKISRSPEIKKEVPVRATRGTLRYIEDDGPLYPRVERSRVQVMPRSVEEVEEIVVEEPAIFVEEEPVVIIEKPRRSSHILKNLAVRGGVVVAVGVITLGVVAAASAFIISTITVQGEAASVSYSLGGI